MKIVFVKIHISEPNTGVSKKIFNQIQNLSDLGLDARLVLITDDKTRYADHKFLECIEIKNISHENSLITIIQRQLITGKILKNIIKSLNSLDILYFRFPFPTFFLPLNFLKSHRGCKIVSEHNNIEYKEFISEKNYSFFLYDFFFGTFIRKQMDGMIGVTNEITLYELIKRGGPRVPHLTVGNGINVCEYPLKDFTPFSGSELRILCIAHISSWHGWDRLLRGVQLYTGNVKVSVNIIGDGNELPYLEKLVNNLNISDSVEFYGFLAGTDLNEIVNKCHIAVGSLGIHRKGLTQTSELKAREYCTRGIPFIIACADQDFNDSFPYILRIPGDETPVDIEEVIEFTETVYKDPEHPKKMRTYATEHLDWTVKIKQLKSFLETLCHGR